MEEKEQKAKEILKEYNQEHIIKWLDKADLNTKNKIINQINEIDLEELEELYKKNQRGVVKKDYKITPITAIDKSKLKKEEKEEYINLGENVLKNGEYAVVTMAGGQGTRLRT